jgi:Serine hydrolase (FSH1)
VSEFGLFQLLYSKFLEPLFTILEVQQIETLLHTRRNFNVTEINAFPDLTASADCKNEFPRFFHPIYTNERISIPTVHVIGSDENLAVKRLAEIAKGLCQRDKVISVVHRGTHEIPHRSDGISAVVRAIEKANFMGQRAW